MVKKIMVIFIYICSEEGLFQDTKKINHKDKLDLNNMQPKNFKTYEIR